jgi:phage tail-like protein
MAEERKNPYAAFNFVVRVGDDTNPIAGFMEVSGLDAENAVIEYREGNDQSGNDGAFVRKQPGMERYPNVVMRRGITGSTALWDLRKAIRNAEDGPAITDNPMPNWTIELQDEAHNPVVTWTLENAWIAKLSGPSLNAKSNEIAIEAIEVVCERIDIN